MAAISAGIPIAGAQDATTAAPPATAPVPAPPPAASPANPAATPPAITTVERTAKGPTAKSIQVGIYLNVLADCTSGALPAIRLLSPPTNGTITIKARQGVGDQYQAVPRAGSAGLHRVLPIQAGFRRHRRRRHRSQISARPNRGAAHHHQCRHRRERRAEDLRGSPAPRAPSREGSEGIAPPTASSLERRTQAENNPLIDQMVI